MELEFTFCSGVLHYYKYFYETPCRKNFYLDDKIRKYVDNWLVLVCIICLLYNIVPVSCIHVINKHLFCVLVRVLECNNLGTQFYSTAR